MNQENLVYPLILSGGASTRLWPLSRRTRPKQFLDIHGDTSLFQQTLARVHGGPFGRPSVICNDEHRFMVAETLRRVGTEALDILLEPVARNTAPAITVAALRLMQEDQDATILVMSSDHVIEDVEAFRAAASHAAALVAEGRLVTFGVVPTRPETGYGYIRRGASLGDDGWQVASFVEKPDLKTARAYLDDGGYFWNAGIFIFRAQIFVDEMRVLQPEIVAASEDALSKGCTDLDFYRLDHAAFEAAPAISVDYAVMEKTDRAAMVSLAAGWSDVGSWAILWNLGDADDAGNVVEGKAVVLDARDNYIRSERLLVAALGVSGIVVVATDDTVLILPKDRGQEVKNIVAHLDKSGHGETISHTRVYRPWGHYQNLEDGDGFLVKRIVVNPGAKLSLQYHDHRAEHWIVVAGTARVTNGERTFDLTANQSTYIPQGIQHRLENPAGEPLQLIEVQTGEYISEENIVRMEDTYGRE